MLALNQKSLTLEKVAEPKPHLNELLISVKAIGINRADLLQREGRYPPPPGASSILGLEVSGIVQEIGSRVDQFEKGDAVVCLLTGGGYAEKVVVPQERCMHLPKNLSFELGAAIPEAFLTAYQALFMIGELQSGQWALIHAAGSGVGTAALQLAKAIDAKTIATTRTQEKLEKCLALGADIVINPTEGGFAKKVLECTQGHGADLILDFMGASYFEENMEAIAQGGAMICLSALGGADLNHFNFNLLFKKWATLCGTTLRNRPLEYVTKLIREFTYFAYPRFEQGTLQPVVHAIFPWKEAGLAHEKLLQNQAFGKIVLIVE